MGREFDNFRLLMWKNWVLQKRHKVQTLVEILAPVVFATLMVLVRSLVEPEPNPKLNFEPFNASKLVYNASFGDTVKIEPQKLVLSYSPETKLVKKTIENSLRYVIGKNFPFPAILAPISRFIDLNGYENASAMYQRLNDPIANDSSLCGIQFDDLMIGLDKFPQHLNLTLRFPAQLRMMIPPGPFWTWKTNFLFPPYQTPGPRSPLDPYGGWPSYVREGFMPLAHALMRQITLIRAREINPNISGRSVPDLEVQRFPHPSFLKDDLIPALQGFISIIILLSFNYTAINTVKVIATEKERQLKEVMKIMGLSNWLHWTAWFIKTFLYLLIAVILIVILLKVEWYNTENGISGYSVFTFTPWHFLVFFMMVYMSTTICFCFMISTFFSKANTAATVAGLVWFLSYAPYTFLNTDRVVPSLTTRFVVSLAHNTAMAYGFEIMLANEATGEGIKWANLFTPMSDDNPFVMGHIILMLLLDAVLYLLIALYVEQVFPGTYGVPQPWYFPVSTKYWKSVFRCVTEVEDIPHSPVISSDAIEPEPNGLNVGINIINMTKIYGKRVAVDRLNLKIFDDQITVLLGHNGAGKTTTMSMLTGMFPPTSGTALIAGHDIRTDILGVRSSLGLCPQHNVLFSDMTVAEHIYFFARLKGVKGQALQEEVNKYVSLLKLEDKRDVLSNALSGGMQRRLSVGAALCGGSRCVLLDEPSSGMDPAARRHLWDLLHMEKKGRSIIMTTHFMDEAEVLGERVAILSGGRLRAVGSPFYLKKKFGLGYRLTAAKSAITCTPPVTQLIRKYIPDAKIYSDIASELSYLLPYELSNQFEPMLKELESKQGELGLSSFGISATNLEEVFMKVGADAVEVCDEDDRLSYKEADADGLIIGNGNKDSHLMEQSEIPAVSQYRHSGARLYINQWKAMLAKKALVSLRMWILSLLQLIIPIMFLIIAILVIRMWQNSVDLPALKLDMASSYDKSLTFINSEGPLTDAPLVNKIKKSYQDYFKKADISTMGVRDIGEEDMEEFYVKNAMNDMLKMRMQNLAGASFYANKIKVWFSNFAHHDLPASVMLVSNAIMDALVPNATVTLINHPLPFKLESKIELLSYGDSAGFQISFNIGFSMAFVSAFFILFYIKENTNRSKLLQFASGASPTILWGAAFVWDIFYFFIITLALLLTLVSFNQQSFSTAAEVGRTFVVLMAFGWGMLPMNYIASSFFHTPSTGFSRMCLFNVFTGLATFLVVEVLYAPTLDLSHVAKLLHWIFLIIPNYAISSALKNLFMASTTLRFCRDLCQFLPNAANCTQTTICEVNELLSFCCISDDPYFEWEPPGVGAHVTYMLIFGVVTFLILLAKEYKVMNLVWRNTHSAPPPIDAADEDSDVSAERAWINDLSRDQYYQHNLLCKDMSKYYGNFLAVNQLSISVKDTDCFGLLGINGAGKTTTFKMLTGDLDVSYGGAWVSGKSVNTDMKTVYQSIGYCPQFDALLDEMTGRETLHFYSKLRGIPAAQQEYYIADLSRRLGFVKHLDKKVIEYSGGNKRKLSTSLALLGDPQVVYLDEPTTGMDPMAKRQVWRAVAGRGCVVLTSHSMEECEALCSKIAIMVNGRPMCLGSPQHLKNKFSQGYTLIVKLKRMSHKSMDDGNLSQPTVPAGTMDIRGSRPSTTSIGIPNGLSLNAKNNLLTAQMFDTVSLHSFLTEKFPNAILKESYQGLMTYYLPDITILWSSIFGIMELAKEQLNIEDYSIGQTSLEQIFLQFTKDQKPGKDD